MNFGNTVNLELLRSTETQAKQSQNSIVYKENDKEKKAPQQGLTEDQKYTSNGALGSELSEAPTPLLVKNANYNKDLPEKCECEHQ